MHRHLRSTGLSELASDTLSETLPNFSVQLFGTWKVTDHLRMRLNGGWRYVTYPSTSKSLDNFWGNLQVDYYWKDFSYGLYAKSKTKWLNFNLMSVTMAAQCGGYVSWNPKNW